MNKPDLIIYGAGGHGRVVVDAALAAGWTIQSWIDDHPPSLTQWDISIVASKDVVWGTLTSRKFIVAIGDNRIRADVYRRLCELGLIPALVIHPSAVISHFARIGEGTMVAADVVVNPVASIGENCILNTGCSVDHDCRMGPHRSEEHTSELQSPCTPVCRLLLEKKKTTNQPLTIHQTRSQHIAQNTRPTPI